MKKNLQNKLNDEKGMTLIELLAVIVIIAMIAAIAIPAIGNLIDNSRINALKADGHSALSAASIYFAENSGDADVTILELKDGGYLEDVGGLGTATTDKINKLGSGNTISAVAKSSTTGTTQVKFNAATNKDISAAGTAATTGTPKVQITR
ncbi:MAG: prepilin-type N-terminal cleavage/methylation domain-containing protein [Carnobacterium alterfunditum]